MNRQRPAATLATAAAAAVLALPANVPAASADTAVREYAQANIYYTGRDGAVYRMDLDAYGPDEVDARPSTVVVEIRRCPRSGGSPCTTVTDARITLPASAFTVGPDLTSAKLTTSFRGIPLTATWTATEAYPGVPGLQVWADTVRMGPQRYARATVTFLGVRCTDTRGLISHETSVSTRDLYAPRSGDLPAALRGSRAPRCISE